MDVHRQLASAVIVLVLSSAALANTPPNTPVITEPLTDGLIVNSEDVHMETGPFSDPDPGDTHACTDWQIWTVTPNAAVWTISCIGGVERVHVHLGDGVFQGSHAGRTSLFPSTNYQLRVRHKDSSGDIATQWSAWAVRAFTTAPLSAILPIEMDDVATSPAPSWTDTFGLPIVLPAGADRSKLRLDSADGQLLLEFRGDVGGNLIVNPPTLAEHVAIRVHFLGGPGLIIPESNLTFEDDHGVQRTVYLPALSLAAGQEAYYWVSANGSTFVGQSTQTEPDFSTLARGAPVPWSVFQPGYRVEVVAGGFQLPVNIAFVPNPGSDPDDPYFYVSELYGAIKVVRRDGVVGTYATNLLNFAPTGQFPGSGEQGLTGIAVDPATGDVFAGMLYDSAPPNGAHYPKVVRFHSTDGGLTAATQTTIVNMVGETQGQSHQISNFSFGPADGKLYVHMGDGFTTATAQNLASFRGKILRLNTDGTAVSTNPFYNAADGITPRDYVFAYGFRNPFGGAWRGADGLHYEVENGPAVDRMCKVNAGQNYLWDGSDASMANFAIYNWNPAHGPVNMAFVQPQTFGGSQFPADKMGHMFISESGTTWGTGFQSNGKRIVEFVLNPAGGLVSGPATLIEYNGTGKASCVGLTAGPDGLYFTDLYKDQGYASPIDTGGNVLRVRFEGTADFSASLTSGPAPLTVQFTDLSNAPSPSAWYWSFGDGGTSSVQHPTHTYTSEGIFDVRLAVTASNGLVVEQKNALIRVGTIPKIAVIGGSIPPGASDAAFADHLRGRGFDVTSYDDEPANRPSAAQLGAQYDLVVVSSTITSGNVAGQFRTVPVPLLFWERGLLQTDREALSQGGVVVGGATAIDVTNNVHPVTQGLALGNATVFSPAANMTVGNGVIASGTALLATRAGSSDYAMMTAEAGAALLGGYVAPARRVFVCLEDASWLSAASAMEQIVDQAVCWVVDSGAPVVVPPADLSVFAGDSVQLAATVTSTPPATLQWRHNGLDLTDGGRISGATTSVLIINPVLAGDAGSYELVAVGACGSVVGAPTALTVQILGDANCDGTLDTGDVDPFALALADPAQYAAEFPNCPLAINDVNRDGVADGLDVAALVAALLQ